ncbi:MAG: hypothetical protein EOO91_19685 [Pedobacter sp.]|nr:MAG: hypothetical protein EOO91_19685 [Pedobacter sp.]
MQITSFEQYQEVYQQSVNEPEQFWSSIAENFVWKKKWDKVLSWNFKEPNIKWFEGAKLNITENCLDRHLSTDGDKPAIIWEPNNPEDDSVILTYKMLHEQVCRFANVLKRNGAQKGDRICIYMPMVPELAIAVLACARIGAVHSVVFGGFSAKSIADREVYFCTADIGWITGHSYIVYGPLSQGATSLIFEGIPTFPTPSRFWDIVEKHKVNTLYTAPTAIRSLMGFGDEPLVGKDLSSIRVLGSVGEPINEEAWHWFDEKIGHQNAPIVDTWWQTETGGIMISPIATVTPTKPSFATLPLPGIQPILVDENGKEIEGNGVNGNLCIKFPWPGMLRTTYGDHERCKQTYFSTYENLYFTGDGCLRDEDGYYRITGRVDDVLNVSGHRIGTAEVENAINMHAGVIESAVVGYPHDVKGQGIYAFVIFPDMHGDVELTKKDILQTVTRVIGAIAKPDKVLFVSGLPKTRSGKIMRRILRKIAEGETTNLGDISTLLDPTVVQQIIDSAKNS